MVGDLENALRLESENSEGYGTGPSLQFFKPVQGDS